MEDIQKLYELVDALRSTNSRKNKETILYDFLKPNREILKYIRLVYDPYVQFNLTSSSLPKKITKSKSYGLFCGKKEYAIYDILMKLKNKELAGNEAREGWLDAIDKYPKHLMCLLNDILDKDLKCQTGLKTINKILKKIKEEPIKDFQVALGVPYTNQNIFGKTEYYASRKYDGVRCVVFCDGTDIKFYSRTGKMFYTLSVLEKAIKECIKPNLNKYTEMILDGELSLINKDNSDDFQGVMKQIRRKNHTIKNIRFNCFDCLYFDEFVGTFSECNLVDRLETGKEIFNFDENKHFKLVKQWKVESEEYLSNLIQKSIDEEWEGLILRANLPYKGKRSEDILKVKKMQDDEFKIVAIELGEKGVLENGRKIRVPIMASAIVSVDGFEVGVGSGWSDDQRIYYAKYPKRLINKKATIQFFEKTNDKHGNSSLRFPVVKYVHNEEKI